ncbi:MAG TPA: cobalamin-independent methionine synthase II family protein [Gammaproteobacteria bacterium]|nr:cobalamin-independent methionine synthase II family protein [Gammaproteobacteria bacterium]
MRRSASKILTTHVGALPGPLETWEGEASDAALRAAVQGVVAAQQEAGTDVVNEGELTKGGNWVTFINSRLSGFVGVPAEGTLRLLSASKDWQQFDDFYAKAMAGGTLFEQTASAPVQTSRIRDWICREPIRYTGQASLQREIDLLKASLGSHAVGDAFLTSTAPASIEVGRKNEYYKSDEEFVYALADALRVEYETIAKAGLNVQIDDAWLPALWDRIGVQMGLEAYQRYCMLRVEALNHALENVPEEQIRYHLCWGSWHGPHAHDIPMADMVDIMLSVKAQMYLFEAANARHEHEYTLWERVPLPKGKILAPGVVSHATALIEHPELVSQRIQRFAKLVGRDNVVASTDCGLGLRCHPQIAWAKLAALSQGAALASRALGY